MEKVNDYTRTALLYAISVMEAMLWEKYGELMREKDVEGMEAIKIVMSEIAKERDKHNHKELICQN